MIEARNFNQSLVNFKKLEKTCGYVIFGFGIRIGIVKGNDTQQEN
jgi:hypothetical protein